MSERDTSLSVDRPLFIPLKREYYEQFKSGEKHHEYRKFGKRWNMGTVKLERPVVLSLGYGKQDRLYGRVGWVEVATPETFHSHAMLTDKQLASVRSLYGAGKYEIIRITINDIREAT